MLTLNVRIDTNNIYVFDYTLSGVFLSIFSFGLIPCKMNIHQIEHIMSRGIHNIIKTPINLDMFDGVSENVRTLTYPKDNLKQRYFRRGNYLVIDNVYLQIDRIMKE